MGGGGRPPAVATATVSFVLSATSTAIVVVASLTASGVPADSKPTAELASRPAKVRVSERLSNHELAGQRIVTTFPGTTPPPVLIEMIRRGKIAGVVLFDGNASTAVSARKLTKRLQSIPQPKGLRRPLLVMTDQEGGLVKRIAGPPDSSAETMGARGSAYTQRQGRKTGKLLRSAGINIDLAPVLDVGRPGGAIASEHRSFGSSAKRVSKRASAFARGLRGGGTIPTAKHFPGLGAAAVNTDDSAQRIDLSRSKLRRIDERPYARFRKGGRGLVMLSLATYRAFGRNPAALSREIAAGELRRRLNFHGVSISDSLQAAAAREVGSTKKVARKTAGAGTDLLLYTNLDAARTAGDSLAGLLRKRKLSRERFSHSVERVLELRRSLGN